jgi:GNAT superfamily N-acetyltransferase
MTDLIRCAEEKDVPAMAAVELAAAQRYSDSDVPPSRKMQTLDLTELGVSLSARTAWVAQTSDTNIVGFVAAVPLDGVLFVLELDVLPAHQGRGVGTALLDTVAAEAWRRGCVGVTLTTFSHVPWNGPFYERRGFQIVADSFLSHLGTRLSMERASGLQNRQAMLRRCAHHVAEQSHAASR